ncbi:MAG: isoleucine--tRNA ligase, partial [Gammaproteobacteria bacterium]
EGPVSVAIWTTTPWTLPASLAVCVHPELEYVLIQGVSNGALCRFVLAQGLAKTALERWGIEDAEVLGVVLGQALEGLRLQHPFYEGRQVPILLGQHVTVEAGTGCVHTAPDHGVDDFYVARRYGIETINLIDDHGVYRAQTEQFAGEHVYKVDPKIIALLRERGRLLAEREIEHSYPHCWRTKTPLIFRATPQWFVSMTKNDLLKQAKTAIKNVSWYPSAGLERMSSMLDLSPDWCISRQRTWGVPLPFFVHRETETLHPDTAALIEEVAQLVEKDGIDAWYDLDYATLLGEDADSYRPVTDTLDVWFDSGVTHFSVLRRRDELAFPADLYLEGSDQHRGWFQSSLKTSIGMYGQAPYKAVFTNGFTVDAQGRKMSKSLGNVISPQKIVNDLGADVLRLWVSATDCSAEVTVSPEILKQITDYYRRIRNTSRFLLANLHDFDPEQHLIDSADMVALDVWLLCLARNLQEEIKAAYERFDFLTVYQRVHRFCSVELGGFYLDIIKDRQYTLPAGHVARRSAQSALFHVLHAMVRWIAPILSFTAEEIWEHVPGANGESVFFTTWYEPLETLDLSSDFDAEYWQQLIAVRSAVNKEIEKVRQAGDIGGSLEAKVTITGSKEFGEALNRMGDELRFLLMVSAVEVGTSARGEKSSDAEGFSIQVSKVNHKKCERCWHHRASVGQSSAHPTLCARCEKNVADTGEERRYV